MKIANTFALIVLLIVTAGCSSHDRHHSAYSSGVISSPAPQLATDSDRALADAVRQRFNRYGDLAPLASEIQVSARNGAVTLTGTVPTEQEKKMIDGMAENTSGVRVVYDNLRVTSAPAAAAFRPTDTPLANRVRQDLNAQPAIAGVAPNIQVFDNNGAITLTGTVAREEDRRLVESVVQRTPGVTAVYDNLGLGIQPTGRTARFPDDIFNLHVEGLSPPDRTLAQKILDGLRRDAMLASLLPSVNINIIGGRVVLQGTVQNDQQRSAIASAVQRAAGLDNVDDQLQVHLAR